MRIHGLTNAVRRELFLYFYNTEEEAKIFCDELGRAKPANNKKIHSAIRTVTGLILKQHMLINA